MGAFYANHPGSWGGYLKSIEGRFDPTLFHALTGPRGIARPMLRLSDETQRRHELLNCWINVSPRVTPAKMIRQMKTRAIGPTGFVEAEAGFADGDVANLAADVEGAGASVGPKPNVRGAPARGIAVGVNAEPTPNPSSVVRLDDELDAFGQRRAVLDWRLVERDSESARETLRVFAREIAAAGVGRFRLLFPSAGFESVRTIGSHHHMGTTRMSLDPRQGVVDPNCRIHGIANLYVAGSSVFPTYGTANPTYTILALAFRLADRLHEELSA